MARLSAVAIIRKQANKQIRSLLENTNSSVKTGFSCSLQGRWRAGRLNCWVMPTALCVHIWCGAFKTYTSPVVPLWHGMGCPLLLQFSYCRTFQTMFKQPIESKHSAVHLPRGQLIANLPTKLQQQTWLLHAVCFFTVPPCSRCATPILDRDEQTVTKLYTGSLPQLKVRTLPKSSSVNRWVLLGLIIKSWVRGYLHGQK